MNELMFFIGVIGLAGIIDAPPQSKIIFFFLFGIWIAYVTFN